MPFMKCCQCFYFSSPLKKDIPQKGAVKKIQAFYLNADFLIINLFHPIQNSGAIKSRIKLDTSYFATLILLLIS